MTHALPVLDLSRASGAGRGPFLEELRTAAHDVGFFYVTGHGVPRRVTADVLAAAREFFALPLEERLAIDNVGSPQFRGYTCLGNEHTRGRPDQRDQFDVGPERAALRLGPDDPPYLRLTGPNLWPTAQPGLRDAVLAWFDAATTVSIQVLRALAASLGQDEHWFDPWFDAEAHHHLKVVRYPGRTVRDGDQGVGEHKDYGWLALLLQDGIGGLEVQRRDGSWVAATPLADAFVVNIGEMLEVATDGYLRATMHRVTSPDTDADRISVPFFLGPRLDAVIPRLPLPAELAADAPGVTLDPDNPLSATYGENALKGWLRAHPRVTERWWSDVVAADA